jgi:hypothetical protein
MQVEQVKEYRSSDGRGNEKDCRNPVMQPENGYDPSHHLCEERYEIKQIEANHLARQRSDRSILSEMTAARTLHRS